jgi:hypothetical protein
MEDPMTNHGLQVIVPVKEELNPKPPERFTQRDRDEANQRLQEAFENERIRRGLSPTLVANASASTVSGPPKR